MKQRKRPRRSARVIRLRACEGGIPEGSTNGTAGQGGGQDWRLVSRRRRRPAKKRVTLYLDADVLAWFRGRGPRYQREINSELRKLMMEGDGGGE